MSQDIPTGGGGPKTDSPSPLPPPYGSLPFVRDLLTEPHKLALGLFETLTKMLDSYGVDQAWIVEARKVVRYLESYDGIEDEN